MKMISGGIGWLVESGKKFGNAAKIGGIAILSTLAIVRSTQQPSIPSQDLFALFFRVNFHCAFSLTQIY
jgi:hypothetical protein